MKFTLIATVCNEAVTTHGFVDSLLEQTRKSNEILIVDGESTDATHDTLADYAARGLLRGHQSK